MKAQLSAQASAPVARCIDVGERSAVVSRAAYAALALALMDHARRLGMTRLSLGLSKRQGSPSRYVTFHDAGGRRWLIRVSNHRSVGHSYLEVANFDLVSRDGSSGLEAAKAFIDSIATGEAIWHDPAQNVRQTRRKGRR